MLEQVTGRGGLAVGAHADHAAVEAGHADYWYKYVGLDGRVIGMRTYGESAPAGDLFKHFGFTVENVVQQATELLEG